MIRDRQTFPDGIYTGEQVQQAYEDGLNQQERSEKMTKCYMKRSYIVEVKILVENGPQTPAQVKIDEATKILKKDLAKVKSSIEGVELEVDVIDAMKFKRPVYIGG